MCVWPSNMLAHASLSFQRQALWMRNESSAVRLLQKKGETDLSDTVFPLWSRGSSCPALQRHFRRLLDLLKVTPRSRPPGASSRNLRSCWKGQVLFSVAPQSQRSPCPGAEAREAPSRVVPLGYCGTRAPLCRRKTPQLRRTRSTFTPPPLGAIDEALGSLNDDSKCPFLASLMHSPSQTAFDANTSQSYCISLCS